MTPHHHLLHPVILLLLLSIAASCGSRSTIESQLDNIETVISDNPDSALTLLDAIPIDSLTPRPTRARQALLKSRALHKAFIDITSDSIINIALDYYTSASSPYALAEAHFYKGRIHMYQGRDRSAMTEYLNAENVLLNAPSDEHFLLGMIYQSICFIFSRSYLWAESLEYAKKSVCEFEQLGDSLYIAHANRVYSHILYLNDDYNSTKAIAKEVAGSAIAIKDTILLSNALILVASSEYAMGNIDSAYHHILELEKLPHPEYAIEDCSIFIDICNSFGDKARADSFAKHLNSLNANYLLPYEIYMQDGKYRQACNILIELLDSINYVTTELSKQSVSLTFSKFRDNQTIMANEREQKTKTISIITIISLIMFFIIGAIIMRKSLQIHRQREHTMQLENENFVLQVQKLTQELKDANEQLCHPRQNENNDSRPRKSDFVSLNFKHLDNVCRIYFENTALRNGQQITIKQLQNLMHGFKLQGKHISSLEAEIDKITNGALSTLRSTPSTLIDEDYHLLILSVVGFSPASIALIMDLEPQVIYNRRARLKTRLNKIGIPESIYFVKFIS